MTISRSRAAMIPISRRVRAYFAPVDRTTETPAIFDPAKFGAFSLDSPPPPWLDLGWIDNFARASLTSVVPLRAGPRGAPSTPSRGNLDARVEFDFREWGKLQMALAAGSEHMNVLAASPAAAAHPSGGTPLAAVPVLAGSTAGEVIVGAAAVASFVAGDIIAVDADYALQTGYVGSGISGGYVGNPIAVGNDPNYVRRVTFNVARVSQLTAVSLLLAQPLLAGAPPAGWRAQKVAAFVDREGGSFFQEWSALFVAEEESGGRVCFHYPRLAPVSALRDFPSNNPPAVQREQPAEIAKPVSALALHAAFTAMPYTDENDGQTALCYRSYFPAPQADLY
jgi:hypothetical protein